MPLRVVEGASKFIEGASLYKTFTIGLSPVRKQASLASLEEMHSPFGGWRHHLSAPLGSVSLDSQSPMAPCESCDTLSRGESPAQPDKGWRAQRANQQNAYYAI